jgi:dCMP deaminase
MRPSKDEYFIRMAVLVSERATCLRRKVGCVLVNARGHVIGTGYNGVASRLPHCNHMEVLEGTGSTIFPNACDGALLQSGTGLDLCEATHSEQNALLQCKDVYEIDTAYVTTKPCVSCMKLFMNTSCKRIVYLEDYPHSKTDELAMKARITLEKFNADSIS